MKHDSAEILGNATVVGSITAGSIIKSGGTSSQYLMADGSVSTLSTGVTQVNVSTGLDVINATTTPTISLDFTEFTDMTADVVGTQDELIILDNSEVTEERRKRLSEIKLSAFNNDLTLDNYNGWALYTDNTSRGTITKGEQVRFNAGSNVTLGYSATNNTITINASVTGGANQLSDLSDVGTVGYTNRHVLIADGVNYDSRALTKADISDFGTYDNYGGWTLSTDGTSRGTIVKNETVNFVGGTSIGLSYSATNNTITINSTGTNSISGGNGISTSGTTAVTVALTTLSSNWNAGNTYTITANDFVLGSDERIKTNIKELNPTNLDIKYVEYEYKEKLGEKRFGVIAQDLQKICPELVRETNEGILQVSYIDLLVKEIANLKEEIKNLKLKIN